MPDFEKTKPPSYEPPEGAVGPAALRGDDPFVMQADGKGWLYAPDRAAGRADADALRAAGVGRSRNPLYEQQGNPTRKVYGREDNPSNPSPMQGGDPRSTPSCSRRPGSPSTTPRAA